MKFIRREDIDIGTITLNEIDFMMAQNHSRAAASGLELSWKREGGLYWGKIRDREKVVFRSPTRERTLLKALIAMHLDFRDYLDSRGMKRV